ncbi:Di-copper centre-containing protein [Ceratobasidium sp. AG-I]|nr:Di-copper centre-containing protein [Ceratobasidium sp. AG-I]
MRFSTLFSLAFGASAVYASSKEQCLRNPAVRKEWRDLTDKERLSFISALKCLAKKPHKDFTLTGSTPDLPPQSSAASFYDDLVYIHMDTNNLDHFTAIFLPWHRWFLHTLQDNLKNQCGFKGTIPFWDWSRDVATLPVAPVFNGSATHGLGTFGSTATGFNVTNGAFNSTIRQYPAPHHLQRNFTLYPFRNSPFPFTPYDVNLPAPQAFTPEIMDSIVSGSTGNFTDFAYKIDGRRAQGPHNAAHLMTGGDMASLLWSPNDPIFWLHHAQLDCTWARWQQKNGANLMAFGGGLKQDLDNYDIYPAGAPPPANLTTELPTAGITSKVLVKDVMLTRNEYLCYKCAY